MLHFGNGDLVEIVIPVNNRFGTKYKRDVGLEYKLLSKPLPPLKMYLTLHAINMTFFGSQLGGDINDAALDVKQGFRIVMCLCCLHFLSFWFELFSFMNL